MSMNGDSNGTVDKFKVIVIGAGIGGLAAAIECLRYGLEVVILEKAPEISPIGAGIQIPPNAARVIQHFGLEQAIRDNGGVQTSGNRLKRYENGRVLATRPGLEKCIEDFGAPWFVIHRADYHNVLLQEALRLGAHLRKNAEVVDVETSTEDPWVALHTGEKVYADVIVAADGLWSPMRDIILGKPSPPTPTGDLAYRGTFSRADLESFNDPGINELINSRSTYNWMGPDRHSVFYPVKDCTSFNLVLIRPDDLPADSKTAVADIDEMRMTYEGWDPVLKKIISCHNNCLKWKLCHHAELPSWVKGNVVIIGDASHPSLPYQAQGAAQAVEDGLVLGTLLGRLSDTLAIPGGRRRDKIHDVLVLFEKVRKPRTTLNVQGALGNRKFYHMHDGPEQEQRDKDLAEIDWVKPCKWHWADPSYQKNVLGFDMVKDANEAFGRWADELQASG